MIGRTFAVLQWTADESRPAPLQRHHFRRENLGVEQIRTGNQCHTAPRQSSADDLV